MLPAPHPTQRKPLLPQLCQAASNQSHQLQMHGNLLKFYILPHPARFQISDISEIVRAWMCLWWFVCFSGFSCWLLHGSICSHLCCSLAFIPWHSHHGTDALGCTLSWAPDGEGKSGLVQVGAWWLVAVRWWVQWVFTLEPNSRMCELVWVGASSILAIHSTVRKMRGAVSQQCPELHLLLRYMCKLVSTCFPTSLAVRPRLRILWTRVVKRYATIKGKGCSSSTKAKGCTSSINGFDKVCEPKLVPVDSLRLIAICPGLQWWVG